MSNKVYLIGSLRNPNIIGVQKALQLSFPNVEIFADWMAAGPEADDCWKTYEQGRGKSFKEALDGHAATHVFNFDKTHLVSSTAVVLVAPAGKSAHLELGWCLGQGKPGFILLDNPDRWDVMYKFATGVHEALDTLCLDLADHLFKF